MIKANMGCVRLSGSGAFICTELEEILRNVYKMFTEDMGEEAAKELIAQIGRNAFEERPEVDMDTLPEEVRNLISKLEALIREEEGEEE